MGEILSGCEEIINVVLFIEFSVSLMLSFVKVFIIMNMSDCVNYVLIK